MRVLIDVTKSLLIDWR